MKRTGRYSSIGDSYYTGDWGNNHGEIPINMARYSMQRYLSGGKSGRLGRIGNSYWDHWDSAVSISLKFKDYTSISFENLDEFRFTSTEKEARLKSSISTKYGFQHAAEKAIIKLARFAPITAKDVDFIEITARTFRRHKLKGDGLIGFGDEGDVSIVLNPTEKEALKFNEFKTFNIISDIYKGTSIQGKYVFS